MKNNPWRIDTDDDDDDYDDDDNNNNNNNNFSIRPYDHNLEA